MASWRDSLGPASFRGAAFHVDASEYGGGRRTVVHEYPLREQPYVEDLGRLARSFPVEGYVLGASYRAARDALIAALEAPGSGELVHPYYGTRRVAVDGAFRVRESSRDGGMATFSISFIESSAEPPSPVAKPAAGAKVAATAAAARAAAESNFLARYLVSGLPASALTSLSGVVVSAARALGAGLLPFVQTTQALAGLKRQLDHLVLDADALVRSPFGVVGRLNDVIRSLGTAPLTPTLGVRALLTAYGFTSSTARPVAVTTNGAREQAAYDALLRLVRTGLAIQAAELAPTEAFDTYDAAVALRDAIVERIEDAGDDASDDAYAALGQLRADLVRAVPGEESDLPRLVRLTPATTVPSLVLAHRLYGSLEREPDLVARNRVARPGFVIGGVQLEVLSRDA